MFNNHVIYSVRIIILRGKLRVCKCFWNTELGTIKAKYDRLKRKAKRSRRTENAIAWCRQTSTFNKQSLCKRKTFISNLNFKENSVKTYTWIEKIQNKSSIFQGNQFILKTNAFPMKVKFQMLLVNSIRYHRGTDLIGWEILSLSRKTINPLNVNKFLTAIFFQVLLMNLNLTRI